MLPTIDGQEIIPVRMLPFVVLPFDKSSWTYSDSLIITNLANKDGCKDIPVTYKLKNGKTVPVKKGFWTTILNSPKGIQLPAGIFLWRDALERFLSGEDIPLNKCHWCLSLMEDKKRRIRLKKWEPFNLSERIIVPRIEPILHRDGRQWVVSQSHDGVTGFSPNDIFQNYDPDIIPEDHRKHVFKGFKLGAQCHLQ